MSTVYPDITENPAVVWPDDLGPLALGTNTAALPDVSASSPADQRAYLENMIERADARSPAPPTNSPPWDEGIEDPAELVSQAVVDENYEIFADPEPVGDAELLSRISDAYPPNVPAWTWENDDQYGGLGVPPGVENLDQPIESGHTQIVLPNPSAGHGEFAWSGKPSLARVARMENHFWGYSKGVRRRFGDYPVEKLEVPLVLQTQQYRDLLLIELKRRGVHNVVVKDVPSVPYTEEVVAVDPRALIPEADIGPEGVLP